MADANTHFTISPQLKHQYDEMRPRLDRFLDSISEQLLHLVKTSGVLLGIPLERRVKSWDSISSKVMRTRLSLSEITDLEDLVGLRLILLFKRDLAKVHELLTQMFTVLKYEDTSTRLEDTKFGYMSVHYLVGLPESWLKTPTLSTFGDLRAEIQVRTLAQHIWAASTHELQYKNESSVPLPIRRTIYRVSALLETVDLEFERVLAERESYVSEMDPSVAEAKLNVDLLRRVLDDSLPQLNKREPESYEELLQDLNHFQVDTVGKLGELIASNLKMALEHDREVATDHAARKDYESTTKERSERGVFYTHVGLARETLSIRFGDKWNAYVMRYAKMRYAKNRERPRQTE